jgi:Zn-dependent membrane protease YugP
MPFFIDPLYILIFLIGLVLILGPQMYVQKTYKKFLNIAASSGITGRDAAEQILRYNGLSHIVSIEPTRGFMTDHFDPTSNTLRLSEDNYYGRSISAISVAAHEAGHALQHNLGYGPIKARSAFFPAAALGSNLGPILLMVAMFLMFFMGVYGISQIIALVGIILFGAAVAFQFLTLPVEFNASSRALQQIKAYGLVSSAELSMSRSVLNAAALTYVAAALYSLMNLLYYVYIFFGSRD